MGSRTRGVRVRYPPGGNPIREKNARHKSISITVLDLDTDEVEVKHENNKYEEMREMKMIQEFQTRRKYNNVRKAVDVSRDKTLLELGLSGTRYRFGGGGGGGVVGSGTTTYHVDADGSVKSGDTGREEKRIETTEDKSNMSARLALPPISPRSAKSENSPSFPPNSLLSNEFGFRKQNTDTFCGIFYKRTLEPSELEKELEVQSKRHIYACSNLGSVRNTSRAAQSVLRLKQTMTRGLADGRSRNGGDTSNRSASLTPKKASAANHKIYPTLSRSIFKPSANPTEDLPIISGSSMLHFVAGRNGV